MTNARVLRGTELRYVLIRLIQLIGPATIPDLVDALQNWGFAVEGRSSKTISDALRWERRRGRVGRRARGLYYAGDMPRSTEHRIIWRVEAMRCRTRVVGPHEQERQLSLGGGHKYWWSRRGARGAAGERENREEATKPQPDRPGPLTRRTRRE